MRNLVVVAWFALSVVGLVGALKSDATEPYRIEPAPTMREPAEASRRTDGGRGEEGEEDFFPQQLQAYSALGF